MIEIKPVTSVNANITVPSSKSYSNRALIAAALGDGESHIYNLLECDDTNYMIEAVMAFGINVINRKSEVIVEGCKGLPSAPDKNIFVGNAGTAMRFLSSFAALCPGETIIDGNKRMRERPLDDLIVGLVKLGVDIQSLDSNGCPPVIIKGGGILGGTTEIKGEKSSQFFTSILLSAPYAYNDVTINVSGELTSKPYIDLTLDLMRAFGAHVENNSYSSFFVKSGIGYKARNYTVEADASSSTYFFSAAAITGGKVRVKNLRPDTLQGDIKFINILEKMGCHVIRGENYVEVAGGKLKGVDVNMNEMPDAVQTLAVTALFAEGETRITGVSNLRIKETDRIKALAIELSRLGGRVEELKDGLIIFPGKINGGEIETYDDHRMAMSFALAGLKIPGIKIKNPECVNKSFPDYFEKLESL